MVTWIPDGLTEVKYWDLFEKYHFAGDTSLIHKTEVAKVSVRRSAREKFIAETSVYYRLDDHYLMRTDNTILTICHYLPDGLTKNFAKNARENPIGYRKHKLYCAQRSQTLAGKFRETTLYLVGCRMTGEKGGPSKAPNKRDWRLVRASGVRCLPHHIWRKEGQWLRVSRSRRTSPGTPPAPSCGWAATTSSPLPWCVFPMASMPRAPSRWPCRFPTLWRSLPTSACERCR